VGKAAEGPGVRFTTQTTDFLFSEKFGTAAGPNKPPIHCPGTVPSGQAVCLSTQPHLVPRLRANHTPTPDFVACMVTNLPFISSVCPHVFYAYVKRGSCTSQCTHTHLLNYTIGWLCFANRPADVSNIATLQPVYIDLAGI
jgi:hypothetical protein